MSLSLHNTLKKCLHIVNDEVNVNTVISIVVLCGHPGNTKIMN